MARKKPPPEPEQSSSSDESESNREDSEMENKQGFVRSDRIVQKSVSAEEDGEDDDHEEEEEEEDDDDDDEDPEDDHGAKAHPEEPDSCSETSSASQGKPDDPLKYQFLVAPRKLGKENGQGKKLSTAEKTSILHSKLDLSPKRAKSEASKRERDGDPHEKGSSKKQRKEHTEKPSKTEHFPKTEKVNKEKHISEMKKSAHAIEGLEKPKSMSSKKLDNASAKKVPGNGKNDKKVVKDAESELVKEPASPMKPKLWTAKDEILLSTEILGGLRRGVEIPAKRSDSYWTTLAEKFEGRMEGMHTKEQLCDKVKRMKTRYATMAEKFKDSEDRKFRNSTDRELFGLWNQIWGNGGEKSEYHNEGGEVKDKLIKPVVSASPVKKSKAARDKVASGATPVQEIKAVHEESRAPKSKQSDKESNDEDESESEESEDEADSVQKNFQVTPMEVDQKDAHAIEPKGTIVQVEEKVSHPHSIRDTHKLFRDEVQATLLEIREYSKQTLEDWQNKATAMAKNVIKAAADQSIGIGGGRGGLFDPVMSFDLMDSEPAEREALCQQWHELRLKELDVYRLKLELMQRECELKQDRLKLHLRENK